tara:strand:- start:3819 stop:4247 length:429 start_codon:yes stop_codon:yes gene_type:complete
MKKLTTGILAGLSAAAVIATGAILGVSSTTAEPEPSQAPTAVVVTVEENTLRQETPNTVRQTVLPAPVLEEAVVEPAPVQAPVAAPAPTPAPEPEPAPDYGTPIPWIADPNPNNAEGGYWDTTQCASGAGYQAPDGNQYCAD